MKVCPNPDCLSHQQNRTFYDSDVVCPRCGEVLVNPNLAAGGTAPPDAYAYAGTPPAAAAARRNTVSSELALLGAAGTLLLAFLLVALMIAAGWVQRGGAPPGTPAAGVPGTLAPTLVASPGTVVAQATPSLPPAPLSAEQATATAHALATIAAQPTPVGGYLASPTPLPGGFTTSALPTLPPPLNAATPGTGGALPAPTVVSLSNIIIPRLCRSLSPGQLCQEATSYGTHDVFYIAVQATFGDGAAQSVRVRLYGPPNGETPLLAQDQSNTPGRSGTYWVGFGFSQNQPWAPGIYRADVFINNDPNRVAYVAWTVQ